MKKPCNLHYHARILITVVLLLVKIHDGNAFIQSSSSTTTTAINTILYSSNVRYHHHHHRNQPHQSVINEEEILQMKQDIAKLRAEAETRLQVLTESLQQQEQETRMATTTATNPATTTITANDDDNDYSTTARITDPATGATMRRTTASSSTTTNERNPATATRTTMPSSSSTTTTTTATSSSYATNTKRYPEGFNENTEAVLEAKIALERRREQQQQQHNGESTTTTSSTGKTTTTTTTTRFPDSEYEDTESLLTKRMENDRKFFQKKTSSSSSSSSNSSASTVASMMTTTTTETTTDSITPDTAAVTTSSIISNADVVVHDDAVGSSLLENTRWRLMLNIGREPGTWMPKTWGVSGERLLMTVELEFITTETSNHEIIMADYGDEFLGRDEEIFGTSVKATSSSSSPVRPLRVIDGTATLAPNMREGGRRGLRVRDVGAWRVAPGEGPMGTSVLRFYLDLEEEVRHSGSDVYCPAGRIYCTCGYFPHIDKRQKLGMNRKERIRKEQVSLNAQYSKLLEDDQKDGSLISIDKMKRAKKMMDLRTEATTLTNKMNVAQVQEPDKSLLRLSQNQRVGLTREGGVCCKVQKGLAMEYHILGKFEIASMANREHSDYRELLP